MFHSNTDTRLVSILALAVLTINIQIQDPANPSRWHPMYKRKRGWLFFSNDFDAGWKGRGWRNNGERSRLLTGVYECGRASYEAGARVLLKARAHTPGPGQPIIAQRRYEVPVKVTGTC